MGCLIAEICSLVFGIITVATGKFTLSRNKVVRGAPARIVGVLLMVPLPLAIILSIVVVGAIMARGGGFDPGNMPIGLRLIEPGIFIIFFAAAMVIAAMNAQPAKPKRQRVDVEDDEGEAEEEPRRRRRADGPEDRIRE